MKKDLPFDLQEFKDAHRLVADSQNKFARLVVETVSEQPIFKCSFPDEVTHPTDIGLCFNFSTNITVCGFKVKLYFLTDCTTGKGFLLSLHFTCNDMFIYKQKIDIPAPQEFTLLWSDTTTPSPRSLMKVIVNN
ncbi:MAG: hypothetical protein HFJ58_05735 [Clostridia bacterium]|nr:hypothetical protein [Clostridia bacterium]